MCEPCYSRYCLIFKDRFWYYPHTLISHYIRNIIVFYDRTQIGWFNEMTIQEAIQWRLKDFILPLVDKKQESAITFNRLWIGGKGKLKNYLFSFNFFFLWELIIIETLLLVHQGLNAASHDNWGAVDIFFLTNHRTHRNSPPK